MTKVPGLVFQVINPKNVIKIWAKTIIVFINWVDSIQLHGNMMYRRRIHTKMVPKMYPTNRDADLF